MLAVMFTDRGAERVRLISARLATRAERFGSGVTVVVLDADVAEIFPDPQSVNEALRALAKIAKRPVKRSRDQASRAAP